jgi:hypothetical protein
MTGLLSWFPGPLTLRRLTQNGVPASRIGSPDNVKFKTQSRITLPNPSCAFKNRKRAEHTSPRAVRLLYRSQNRRIERQVRLLRGQGATGAENMSISHLPKRGCGNRNGLLQDTKKGVAGVTKCEPCMAGRTDPLPAMGLWTACSMNVGGCQLTEAAEQGCGLVCSQEVASGFP